MFSMPPATAHWIMPDQISAAALAIGGLSLTACDRNDDNKPTGANAPTYDNANTAADRVNNAADNAARAAGAAARQGADRVNDAAQSVGQSAREGWNSATQPSTQPVGSMVPQADQTAPD
jgi:hypothetical protein